MGNSLVFKIGADFKQFRSAMENVEKSMVRAGKKMKNVGKSMTTSLTAPIALIGGLAIKTFADFEQEMAKVKAVSGATASEFDALSASAKSLGASTRFTASEVAALQLNYSKLGFAPEEINKVTAATLDLALATGEDLAQSALVAANTLRGLGLDASEMGRVTDVMAASFSSSGLDLEKFQESMKLVAPTARATGRSLEETTAMLSVLADNGISGSIAGTQLNRVFIDLNKKGLSLNDAMAKVAGSSNKLGEATKLVGDRGAKALLIMSGQTGAMDKLNMAYNDSSGAAKDMAAIMDNTLQGAMLIGLAVYLIQQRL